MSDTEWRDRLRAAVEASGKSDRAISIASGNGPGYVHSLLVEGKEPKIGRFLAVCAAIPASPAAILFGHDVAPEDEEILDLLHRNPGKRAAIQSLIGDE